MLYPMVPGSSSAPDTNFSKLSDATTTEVMAFAHSHETFDALVIATPTDVMLSYGATHEPINTHSARKSVMNVLFGMAVQSGKVRIDQTLAQIGLDDAQMPLTIQERQAKISDLLKAKSGIYIESAGETEEMKRGRPQRGQYTAGEHFYYNNWDYNTLGSILTLTTGQSLHQHMQRLATRLGFQDYHPEHLYFQESSGSEHDQYTLFLSARDLARIGQMMLRDGLDVQGQPLVSPQWISQSTNPYSITDIAGPFEGYGYLWWLDAQTGTWLASGWGGQYLLVDPHHDLAIVVRNHTGRRLGALLWRVVLNHASQGRSSDVLEIRDLLLQSGTSALP